MNDLSDKIRFNYLSILTSPKQIECNVEFIFIGKVDTINETFSGKFKLSQNGKKIS